MFDSVLARRMMVDGQVRTVDVHNPELIAAMLEVPRERFVPRRLAEQAYVDGELDLGTAAPCWRRWCLPNWSRPPSSRAANTCSMSAAALAIRRPCLRSWLVPLWHWKRTRICAAKLRHRWPGAARQGWSSCKDRWLPDGPLRALRFHPAQWGNRGRSRRSRPPTQARRATRLHFGPRAGGQGHIVSPGRRPSCRQADFRRRSRDLPGFRAAPTFVF